MTTARIPLSVLRDLPAGEILIEKLRAHDVASDPESITLDVAGETFRHYRHLLAAWGVKLPKPAAAIARKPTSSPAEVWPAWARTIARRKQADDVGIGDTFERLAGRFGKRFVAWWKRRGIDCGCARRRAAWNKQYPYPTEQNQPSRQEL